MTFAIEKEFEDALIKMLSTVGKWGDGILEYPTEEDLLQNWANILFENNKEIDRLNNIPLTKSEMQQLLEQIVELKTPFRLNEFINGKTVSIRRDNPEDTLHFGKEISLKIYDRMEIAAGASRYQIARQPRFKGKSPILRDRRGDFMLLINGMPVFHVELKKTGIPVSQACSQIEKYSCEGIFSGLFSLVQIFVAMTPEETLYFANPGPEGKFNRDYYFHWEDVNNEPINHWEDIVRRLLCIPMAHEMIGFYTIADHTDGILKVMRSYQYYAATKISDKVRNIDWTQERPLGGYIWHTTGSGKTMTSFKSAQLIAESQDADKVIFLVDRIELGTQSLIAYQNFASAKITVQGTEDTAILMKKLKSRDPSNTLIVTSVQKMSRIKEEAGWLPEDIRKINSKRIVFIVDECHRSMYGDMFITIRNTFNHAVFFGFTGTPIFDENEKNKSTTAHVFGDELHHYTIADGLRDKNVLGFDPYKITYPERILREVVALDKAKAQTKEEALKDPKRAKTFYKYMQDVPMVGYYDSKGNYVSGIEDFIPLSQYACEKHHKKVVEDILDNWLVLSRNNKFHAILATSSIPEAIEYYRLFKAKQSSLKITALFDSSDAPENAQYSIEKEEALVEILEDYNKMFGMNFTISTHAKFKKDIAARLAHKKPYLAISRTPEKQLNLLIVVNQMLTGFDSKWLNTLFLDKYLEHANIIQAFSRTNRIFGDDKPFGVIRYYRKPYTMEKNIEKAVEMYSGDSPYKLFVQKLPENLRKMNQIFGDVAALFNSSGIENFEKLPEDSRECAKFASLFKEFNEYLTAARIQGFVWQKLHYDKPEKIDVSIDEITYNTLVQRYKELATERMGQSHEDIPYDIDTHLIEIDTGKIDVDYMNFHFEKWLKNLEQPNVTAQEKQEVLDELHKTFALLSQEEQKYANIFLHDVEQGDIIMERGKTLRDYITDYMKRAKNDQIAKLAGLLGIDTQKLRNIMAKNVTESNINEYAQFDELMETLNLEKAKIYFEQIEGKHLPDNRIFIKADALLRNFILKGGQDIIDPKA